MSDGTPTMKDVADLEARVEELELRLGLLDDDEGSGDEALEDSDIDATLEELKDGNLAERSLGEKMQWWREITRKQEQESRRRSTGGPR